jgi:hypothetical protein
MNKIVSITRKLNRPEVVASLRVKADNGTEYWAPDSAGAERTRGILLHFPRPYQGPLPAA